MYLQYACHWSSTTLLHCHCREAKTMSRAQLWHLVIFCFERKLHGSYSFAIILENIFYNFSTINFFSNSPFFVVSALLGYAVSYNQVSFGNILLVQPELNQRRRQSGRFGRWLRKWLPWISCSLKWTGNYRKSLWRG